MDFLSLKNLKSTIYFVYQFCYNTLYSVQNVRYQFELNFIIPCFVMLVNVKYVPVAQLDRVSDSDVSGIFGSDKAESVAAQGKAGLRVKNPLSFDYYLTTKTEKQTTGVRTGCRYTWL